MPPGASSPRQSTRAPNRPEVVGRKPLVHHAEVDAVEINRDLEPLGCRHGPQGAGAIAASLGQSRLATMLLLEPILPKAMSLPYAAA